MASNILEILHGGDVLPYYIQLYILKRVGMQHGCRLSDTPVHDDIKSLYGKKYTHDNILMSDYYSPTIQTRITYLLWDMLANANNDAFTKLFIATYIFSKQFAYLSCETELSIQAKVRIYVESIRNVDAYNTWEKDTSACESRVINHHNVSPGAMQKIRRAKKSKYAYMYELETVLYKKARAQGDIHQPLHRRYLYDNDNFTYIPSHVIFARLHFLKKLHTYTIPPGATIATVAYDICKGDKVLRLEELRVLMANMKGYSIHYLRSQYPTLVNEWIDNKLLKGDKVRL